MTISCVRHPSTGPAQPNGADAPTKIPGPKSDARPHKQDRVHGFLAHVLHGVHHIRALAQHGIAERLRPPGIPAIMSSTDGNGINASTLGSNERLSSYMALDNSSARK